MKMPFGRWRNFELEDLPPEYLRWLLKLDLREPLRGEVSYELDRRRRIAAAIEEIVGAL
jgi:uncharacterized protein (DUF3820 family)